MAAVFGSDLVTVREALELLGLLRAEDEREAAGEADGEAAVDGAGLDSGLQISSSLLKRAKI